MSEENVAFNTPGMACNNVGGELSRLEFSELKSRVATLPPEKYSLHLGNARNLSTVGSQVKKN